MMKAKDGLNWGEPASVVERLIRCIAGRSWKSCVPALFVVTLCVASVNAGPTSETMNSARVLANAALAIQEPSEDGDDDPCDDPVPVQANGAYSLVETKTDTVNESSPAPSPGLDSVAANILAMAGNTKLASDQESPLTGNTGIKQDDPLIESIQSRGQISDQLVVARNSSAVINLKNKVDGVEIADPTIADVLITSPTRVIVTGKAFGTTQLVLRVGTTQRSIAVAVELDLRVLQSFIKSIAPTADVLLRSVNGTVILMGSAPDAETSERIAELATLAQGGEVRNQLVIAGVQQTMLRVVVAEVNKTALRTLGVNWSIGGSDWSRNFFFANNLNQLNPTTFTSSGLPNVLNSNAAGGQLLYSVAPVGNGAATNVTFGFPKGEFQMFMNALRENQLARILAEPNLVAISGQTATFLAGGEVPIPVSQGGAVAGAITIEYKEFGVRLAFTPTVCGGQIIRLHVMSEVSDAVPGPTLAGGLPIFTFTTRRVESTIECGNGQTFAMAGLLREQVRAVADKLPTLGDIPVLGALFSSVRYQKDDSELIVLVTPQLVEPLEPHQVGPPPGALMRDPSDYELFSLGKLEGEPQTPPEYEGVPRENVPVSTTPSWNRDWATAQLALRGPFGLADSEEN
ncbi:MAG: type II and III secretion system protein family protein [Planctomycetota bacterium]